MDTKIFNKELARAMSRIERLARDELPRRIGKMAADHFKENFRQGGFVNGGLQQWKDVKRRDSRSEWYGFEYKGEKRNYYAFSRDKKTGKTSKSKQQKKLNYSPTATKRGVLTSKRNMLMNSITSSVRGGEAVVGTSVEYAKVHNDGGTFKVFGKATKTMPRRQFIGESKELNRAVEKMIIGAIDAAFKF